MDVQVALHSDTLNESGFVEEHPRRHRRAHHPPSIPKGPAAAMRRTSSACAHPNILPSSTNPTLPYTLFIDEHLDMLMVCHHLDPDIARTWRCRSRAFAETIAAEDVLRESRRLLAHLLR
ncbi:hypothetical protein MJ561_25380 [Klebsiella pneumoniae]|nr:hypothetical protein MJ561_25380 [Klebsiella pneumoniae]